MSKKFWSASELETGIYSPIVSAMVNLTDVTPTDLQYVRVGNMVTVIGDITIAATAVGTISFELDLPIASDFLTNSNASGMVVNAVGNILRGYGKTDNDTIACKGIADETTSRAYSIHLTYIIK